MTDKKYWHELSQDDVDRLVSSGATWKEISEKFLQPSWCGEIDPLMGALGCWSLIDYVKGGCRELISPDYCKNCDCFIK